MSSDRDVQARFRAASNDDERVRVLLASEQFATPELLVFLISIFEDRAAYDLVRIEAVKAATLGALHIGAEERSVAEALLRVGLGDPDSDVQNWALQYLAHFTSFADLPARVAPALAASCDFDVRFAAFTVLDEQKANPEALALLRALEADPDLGKYARRSTAEALRARGRRGPEET